MEKSIKPDWDWVNCVLQNASDQAEMDGELTEEIAKALAFIQLWIGKYNG